ncbi:hypothetical protein CFC21_038693 [Triticum aestivum]|uniref:Fe2OG dioxygenase domain-containing protein n=2 Tax=Triticum aestivum TaxID=4565 RepID=A0A3B6EVJ3_WHEAT|nr:hypothetical protein CFC21_038693 [Triticum aestivum]
MEHLPDECELEELEVSTVDLEAEEPRLMEQLAAACRDPGVFRLVNHGVPSGLTARLFGLARGLLELDAANKSRLPGYFCGTPALAALPVKQLNWLEGLHVEADDTGDRCHSCPDGADGEAGGTALAEFMEAVSGEYVAHMARIARKLFDALASGELGLDEEQRASYLTERGSIFRAYRYPATAPGRRQLGMEAHTDSSVLSILNQDMVGGLQVFHGGRWCFVRPVEGALVVNVGDMLQAMSRARTGARTTGWWRRPGRRWTGCRSATSRSRRRTPSSSARRQLVVRRRCTGGSATVSSGSRCRRT